MAVYSMLAMGTTIVGGPLMGWVSQRWSARAAMGVAGLVTMAAAAALTLAARRDREVIVDHGLLVEAVEAAIDAP
jgi:predicted MFS family arabinose efflux permease